jgi:hypothetical protein
MEDNKRIIPITHIYGSPDLIKDLANRLQTTMIGASKLLPMEAMTLAQVAVAHGLDPFNGECWYIKDKNGNPKGVMVGIKGLRKSARRQLEQMRHGANYSLNKWSKEDPTFWDAPKDSIVYRVELSDTILSKEWIDNFWQLKQADSSITTEKFIELFGRPPVTIGIGVYNPVTEFSKMQPTAVAMKRAEADALKKRFDVLLDLEYNEELDIEDIGVESVEEQQLAAIPEATVLELPQSNSRDATPAEPIAPQEEKPATERPYSPEALKARLAEMTEKFAGETLKDTDRKLLVPNLNKMLAENGFLDNDIINEKRHLVLKWLAGVEKSEDLSGGQVLAIKQWIHIRKDSGNEWVPDPMAIKELAAVLEVI